LIENYRCSNNTRDVEFKISLSTEDIDNIVQQIKNDSKRFEVNVMETGDEL